MYNMLYTYQLHILVVVCTNNAKLEITLTHTIISHDGNVTYIHMLSVLAIDVQKQRHSLFFNNIMAASVKKLITVVIFSFF